MKTTLKPTSIAIDDMSCLHCVQSVTAALASVADVQTKSVEVGSAIIVAADPRAAIAALADAGFKARVSDDPPASSSCSCCGH